MQARGSPAKAAAGRWQGGPNTSSRNGAPSPPLGTLPGPREAVPLSPVPGAVPGWGSSSVPRSSTVPGGGARTGCRRVPAERAMPRGGGGGCGAVPACPALVARRGCSAVAGLAEPARSGEPGRRGGNASVIKGTRETWSQQLVAARDTSAKPDPGIAKPAPASPASRRPGPAPALPTRAGWHGRGTDGTPAPGTQGSPTSQHALDAGATSSSAGSAPNSPSQGLHVVLLTLLAA